jgi:hypothetical protein
MKRKEENKEVSKKIREINMARMPAKCLPSWKRWCTLMKPLKPKMFVIEMKSQKSARIGCMMRYIFKWLDYLQMPRYP